MQIEWYSALLIFRLDSECDSTFVKRIESLMVFQANEFDEALNIARQLGLKHERDESIVNKRGQSELRLVFCYVDNLDIIGSYILEKEVWSKVFDIEGGLI